ncbi:DeoR/GlpR family DNA-binding transcription regulator [Clostridium autoethanogenum]|uniref:DeoR/GlpR family DNA-binding transcription regulator n=1 Tax=Clostridium autoethanogenum DSM 10061 TaxID=1341692 RepID=A0ABN4BBR1_9CLOT|nr:DeoR/GlpR family DNA-binding transcription regulator [Clostridium autoethanogenum]AGY74906.1 DeoR/GlpR family DNA-binding transcription regulator [Clostridium autoethanogenum DSM 10061]ALU35083.1 Transcriptional regulator DeoR family [Clostridium autoethanogenum DSM 10061]OVY49418.1 Glycerol-3-phosphate regulon repressor [Clostridium autoethanogenum]
MFPEERHDKIINILHKEGKVVVKDLSSRFNVTEDCIRKDLKILENKNLLQRTYGGAVSVRHSAPKQDISIRKNISVESKEVIAEKAFNSIFENETIFLDISTTNMMLAEKLSKSPKKLTVVTNMLDIISILNKQDNNIKVICTGGVLSKDLDGFTGSMAIESIINYKPNKCFIGSCGVNIFDKSVTTFDVEDGNTKKAIINGSKEIFLVMENSKFYIDGTYKFATLYDIDTIITESPPGKEITNLLTKTDTKFI